MANAHFPIRRARKLTVTRSVPAESGTIISPFVSLALALPPYDSLPRARRIVQHAQPHSQRLARSHSQNSFVSFHAQCDFAPCGALPPDSSAVKLHPRHCFPASWYGSAAQRSLSSGPSKPWSFATASRNVGISSGSPKSSHQKSRRSTGYENHRKTHIPAWLCRHRRRRRK